jgi:hypothetical protein
LATKTTKKHEKFVAVQGLGFKGSGFRVQRFRVPGSKVQRFRGSKVQRLLNADFCSFIIHDLDGPLPPFG